MDGLDRRGRLGYAYAMNTTDEERRPPRREILFCPFCFQQPFDRREIEGSRVYCPVCGVEVEVKNLVKP